MLAEIEKLEVEELFNVEMKLASVLATMERNGLMVDVDRLNQIGET